MVYKTVYTEVEVDVDLGDFDTEDLLDELDSRGSLPVEGDTDSKALLTTIYENRRLGKDYQKELDDLIWASLGKVL
jgi:hypothetical protein